MKGLTAFGQPFINFIQKKSPTSISGGMNAIRQGAFDKDML